MTRLLAIALVWTVGSGCYTLQPVVGNPLPLGTQIGVSITDAGRVALGGSMGPEISLIEGRLVSRDSAGYVLAVSMVHFLRGGEQVWTGERIRIKTEHVGQVSERKLSKGRTAAFTAVGVGILAVIVRQSIVGSLFGDDGVSPVDTLQAIRIPRF